MSLKKLLLSALTAMCAVSLLIPAAYAHGCHGQSTSARRAGCAVCAVENCTLAGRHVHGRTIYCGFDHENGWCDGTCVSLCPVEGCAQAGRHYHDGTLYCGYDHDCGWCDGSCPVYRPASSWSHHGGCR